MHDNYASYISDYPKSVSNIGSGRLPAASSKSIVPGSKTTKVNNSTSQSNTGTMRNSKYQDHLFIPDTS